MQDNSSATGGKLVTLLDPNESNSTIVYRPGTRVSADDVLDDADGYTAVIALQYPIRRISHIWRNAREVAHMRMTGSMGDER